jgi:hypothetical protein
MNKQFIIITTLFTAITFNTNAMILESYQIISDHRTKETTINANGNMRYSYPNPEFAHGPQQYESTFFQSLSLNIEQMRKEGKSEQFITNYTNLMFPVLKENKQDVSERLKHCRTYTPKIFTKTQ